MDIISLETAISAFPQVVENLYKVDGQLKIESEEGSVVILSEEKYENLLLTLEYFSAPGLLNRFRNHEPSETITWDAVLARFTNAVQTLVHAGKQIKIETPQGVIMVLSEETHEHLLVTLEFFSVPGLINAQ